MSRLALPWFPTKNGNGLSRNDLCNFRKVADVTLTEIDVILEIIVEEMQDKGFRMFSDEGRMQRWQFAVIVHCNRRKWSFTNWQKLT